jgi:hypothetical protein
MHRSTRLIMLAIGCGMLSLPVARIGAQQQIVDPDFDAAVARPAYSGTGPTVAIDEAHSNFHTASGQYAPFAALLRNDGYRVVASTRALNADSLAAMDVLVIANARNLPALAAGDVSKSAFTDSECDAVRDWVQAGGSLLLIADHAPYGHAADSLAQRFGVAMGKGWAFDRISPDGITTQLVFSRANGLLGEHPILSGGNGAEALRSIMSFTGQSLDVPSGATVLMKLSSSAREAAVPDDLQAEDAASRDTASGAFGSRSTPVGGRAQGIALPFGQGRVVVLGEAALLSAQILRFTEGDRPRDTRFGMNVPGTDDRQFALNVVQWLSRALN